MSDEQPAERSRDRPRTLANLAETQDHVIRRDQLTEVEVSRGHLRAQLAGRRWQACGPVVVVLHNGPLNERQQQWAAVLNAGAPAALCGRTAAAVAGLEGWPPHAIEIVVLRGGTVPELPGIDIKIHESRRFTSEDVHATRTPPQTRLERSVVDAATWSDNARTACGVLAAAVQQRLTTAERLAAQLDTAGRIRHRRIMQCALADIGGGAQALSEIDFGRLCRRFGLPAPERQVVRVDPQGRRRYLDATLRAPNGKVVRVEVDGALHLLVRTYWDDMDRTNELVIAGETVLRVPTVAMRLAPERVADQIGRALGLSGSARVPAA